MRPSRRVSTDYAISRAVAIRRGTVGVACRVTATYKKRFASHYRARPWEALSTVYVPTLIRAGQSSRQAPGVRAINGSVGTRAAHTLVYHSLSLPRHHSLCPTLYRFISLYPTPSVWWSERSRCSSGQQSRAEVTRPHKSVQRRKRYQMTHRAYCEGRFFCAVHLQDGALAPCSHIVPPRTLVSGSQEGNIASCRRASVVEGLSPNGAK